MISFSFIIPKKKTARAQIMGKPNIIIQNIVASGNIQNNIDLEMAADLLDNVMYEPEQFPGLIYRMSDPKVVLLVFASGKLVITGAKSDENVNEAVYKLYDLLDDYALFY
jgi:transcription initiation factor TFIID TATA-box-binding protein